MVSTAVSDVKFASGNNEVIYEIRPKNLDFPIALHRFIVLIKFPVLVMSM